MIACEEFPIANNHETVANDHAYFFVLNWSAFIGCDIAKHRSLNGLLNWRNYQRWRIWGQRSILSLAYANGWKKINRAIKVDEYNSGDKFTINQSQIPMTIVNQFSSNNWKSKNTIYKICYRSDEIKIITFNFWIHYI